MTRTLLAILLAASALAAGSATAQDTPRTASNPDREAQRRAAFDRIDTNKDGFIDRSESRAARMVIFERLDVNRDGRLTPDELAAGSRGRSPATRNRDTGVNAQTGSAPGNGRPTRAERTFQRLDTNKDGFISRDEWLAANDVSFDRCDANKDGKLAFGECRLGQQASRTRRPTTMVP